MLELLGFPVAASAHAAEIDNLNVLVHWLMLVLFIGWGAFFVYTLVRFRAAANPKATYLPIKGKFAKYVEISVLIAEIALLVFFSVPIYNQRVEAFPSEDESVVVRVVAEQFAWNIHYPGPDRKFGRTDIKLVSAANPLGLDRTDADAKDDLTTINQLNLPVNRPVIVHLSSKDVIHSFALNEMRVKQDAIPGIVHNLWFTPTMVTPTQADGTNTWEIACSQLCGLGHYRMRGFYTIQTPEDFNKFLQEEAANLAAN
jgi:cytochrome c oxidase subunit II